MPFRKKGEGGEKKKKKKKKKGEESRLGEVFMANVFGHYFLTHLLAPLMAGGGEGGREPGRIIWVSSLEAYPHSLRLEDLQGLETDTSYESSKRLTDLLVLTSELPSTQQFVRDYLSSASLSNASTTTTSDQQTQSPPVMYLAHPGICATSIASLPGSSNKQCWHSSTSPAGSAPLAHRDLLSRRHIAGLADLDTSLHALAVRVGRRKGQMGQQLHAQRGRARHQDRGERVGMGWQGGRAGGWGRQEQEESLEGNEGCDGGEQGGVRGDGEGGLARDGGVEGGVGGEVERSRGWGCDSGVVRG
ncbi:3-keto-steroid reductase [Taxawa tesnikishii (nom. ined.)]|nr:3-keto-steroid reductase [Dothideales sp. JES 119]